MELTLPSYGTATVVTTSCGLSNKTISPRFLGRRLFRKYEILWEGIISTNQDYQVWSLFSYVPVVGAAIYNVESRFVLFIRKMPSTKFIAFQLPSQLTILSTTVVRESSLIWSPRAFLSIRVIQQTTNLCSASLLGVLQPVTQLVLLALDIFKSIRDMRETGSWNS